MAGFDENFELPPLQGFDFQTRRSPAGFELPPSQGFDFQTRRGPTTFELPGAGTRRFVNYARKTADNSRVTWRTDGSPDPSFSYAPVAASLLNDHSFLPEG